MQPTSNDEYEFRVTSAPVNEEGAGASVQAPEGEGWELIKWETGGEAVFRETRSTIFGTEEMPALSLYWVALWRRPINLLEAETVRGAEKVLAAGWPIAVDAIQMILEAIKKEEPRAIGDLLNQLLKMDPQSPIRLLDELSKRNVPMADALAKTLNANSKAELGPEDE